MKSTVAAAAIALVASTGAATAHEPMVLSEAQLDRITAGARLTHPGVYIEELPGPSGDLNIQFVVHPTEPITGILQKAAEPNWNAANPRFHLDPPRPVLSGRVPNPK
jgi:hypothetical protein